MDIRFTHEDIFETETEAVVYFTDHSLLGEQSKHLIKRTGERIMDSLVQQNGCATGEVKIVPAFELKSNYIVLSVLPEDSNPLSEILFKDMLLQIFNICFEYNIHSLSLDLRYIKQVFSQRYVAILNNVLKEIKEQNGDILLYLCQGDFIDKE